MTNNQTANYVMGKTREEYQRLRQQAQVLERFTVSVLDRIGLFQGAVARPDQCELEWAIIS